MAGLAPQPRLAAEDGTPFSSSMLATVRGSLLGSLGWVSVSLIVGGLTGTVLNWLVGPATGIGHEVLQWLGIAFLLWAASGRDIQTPGDKTFVERVNRTRVARREGREP